MKAWRQRAGGRCGRRRACRRRPTCARSVTVCCTRRASTHSLLPRATCRSAVTRTRIASSQLGRQAVCRPGTSRSAGAEPAPLKGRARPVLTAPRVTPAQLVLPARRVRRASRVTPARPVRRARRAPLARPVQPSLPARCPAPPPRKACWPTGDPGATGATDVGVERVIGGGGVSRPTPRRCSSRRRVRRVRRRRGRIGRTGGRRPRA